nr:PREDICTED: piggyBac transposable element-derived protein 4-like [Megachile rotundata]
MVYNEEIYADLLSEDDYCSDSESDSDSGSDIIVRRFKNKGTPIISESESDEENSVANDWSEVDFKPDFHACLERCGLQVPCAPDILSTVDLFIGDDLFDLFVTQTNLYHNQQNNDNNNASRKNKAWVDTNVVEMKKFLGLVILMGIVKKPEQDDYWSTHPGLHSPIFGNTMPRNRFRQLWKYWHFNNNEHCQERLDKIKPVYTNLVEKFQKIYKPEKELSLDEGIIPWRGRLSFRTYNPAKMIKYGILVRMVCEASSGYICNLEIYCAQGKSLIATILSVLSPYLNLWHDIYMENYYNSVKVAEELLQRKTNVCGTIRANRGVPNCLKSATLKNKSMEFRRKGKILVQKWNSAKKSITMISTIHSAEMVECVSKKTKKKSMKPICIREYNKFMKGVDHADQYLSYYSILRKTKKWTKKTVLYLINCALLNAYQICIKNSENPIRFKQFLLNLALAWINGNEEEQQSRSAAQCNKRSPRYDPPDRLTADMRKYRITRITGNGRIQNPRRACKVCTAAKKRSSTAYMCSSCNVPLHVGKCFENYHTNKNYES